MNYAEKLKQLRQKLGLSQAQFSQFSGINVHAIRKWERGATVPNEQAQLIILNLDNPKVAKHWKASNESDR